jgi:hypothetical protein
VTWRPGGREGAWPLVLAAFFVLGLAASWQRWGNPLIDTGREMNQPLRLAAGETLYSDVRHIYGPLSPWLHAAVFRASGPSLNVLYADGIVCAAVILMLVYWLGRQIMRPAAAGAATLSVMWLCAFKPAGNYILPYSYNSLHGAVLGLATLAVLVAALKRSRDPSPGPFVAAGVIAGLAVLCKTEIGLAAIAAGLAAAFVAVHPRRMRGASLAAAFLLPALGLTVAVYAVVVAQVGWSTLVSDSWLLFYNVPPELMHFNGWISGFDDPARSVRRMLIAGAKLGIVAAVIAGAASIAAGRQLSARRSRRGWRLLAVAAAAVALMAATTGFDPDKGPYLAMPFLLVGVLVTQVGRVSRDAPAAARTRAAIVITCTVYALTSLARVILHVRSGGAYASYLLPVSVVLFTYLWVTPFARCFRDVRTRRIARAIALTLIAANAVATAAILAYRYQTRTTTAITTARGTMFAEPDVGQAWNEAIAYLQRHTRPGDAIAVMPEGTSINFFAGRRNPLRDEIAIPGVLDGEAEAQAIEDLERAAVPVVLITNRPTNEFGRASFGRDYGREVMAWIARHYRRCAMFGPVKDPRLEIGDPPFFIRAYCRTVS